MMNDMAQDFPLDVEMLLAVLEVIAPQFRHFNKLRDFVSQKLPPGFPIQVLHISITCK